MNMIKKKSGSRFLVLAVFMSFLSSNAIAENPLELNNKSTQTETEYLQRLAHIAPEYPPLDRRKGKNAEVNLSYTIDSQGHPQDILVLDKRSNSAFTKAAIAALKVTPFEKPTWKDQGINSTRQTIRFVFEAREKKPERNKSRTRYVATN